MVHRMQWDAPSDGSGAGRMWAEGPASILPGGRRVDDRKRAERSVPSVEVFSLSLRRSAPPAERTILDDDRVRQRAEPFDRNLDRAWRVLQVRVMDRFAPRARFERRAERDHVAGLERQELADEADHLRDLIVVVARAVLGDRLAARLAENGQVVRVANLVACDEPRADRAERVAALVSSGVRQVLLDPLGLLRVFLAGVDGVVVEAVLGAHAVARDVVED